MKEPQRPKFGADLYSHYRTLHAATQSEVTKNYRLSSESLARSGKTLPYTEDQTKVPLLPFNTHPDQIHKHIGELTTKLASTKESNSTLTGQTPGSTLSLGRKVDHTTTEL